MSDYLTRDLQRYGVAIRDQSEITELHRADGELEAVTLRRLADVVARDRCATAMGERAMAVQLVQSSTLGWRWGLRAMDCSLVSDDV